MQATVLLLLAILAIVIAFTLIFTLIKNWLISDRRPMASPEEQLMTLECSDPGYSHVSPLLISGYNKTVPDSIMLNKKATLVKLRLSEMMLGVVLFSFVSTSAFGQTITTDKPDYMPGDTVEIIGSGWQPGESVQLFFDDIPDLPSCSSHVLNTVANAEGKIYNKQFLIKPSHLGITFILTATGGISGLTAQTIFTDATFTSNVSSGDWNVVDTWVAVARSGNITASTSSAIVTGVSNTNFLTDIAAGDKIYAANGTTLIGTVLTVNSNTNLTLTTNASNAIINSAFTAKKIPSSGDVVNITAGHSISIPASYAASCSALTINPTSGNGATSLSLNANTSSLSVSNSIIIQRPGNTSASVLNVNDGIVSVVGNITLDGTATQAGRVDKISITNGTLTISGNLTFVTGNVVSNVIDMSSGTGTLNLGGAFTLTVGTLTAGNSSIFNFNGSTSAQVIPIGLSTVNYNNLNINNTHTSGATLANSNITPTRVTGNLNVQSGVFNNGGFGITLASNKSFNVSSDATFILSGTSTMPVVSGTGAKTFGTTSTVEYAGTGPQTVSSEAYGRLKVSGTANIGGITISSSDSTTLSGTLTFSSNLGTKTFNKITILSGGNWDASASNNENFSVSGHFKNNGIFTAGGGIYSFDGAAQNIEGNSALTFQNLTIGGSGDKTLGNDVTINSTLTLNNRNIDASTNSKIVYAKGLITRNATGHVIGNLRKDIGAGTTSKLFEIGDAINYTPLALNFEGITNAVGTITAYTLATTPAAGVQPSGAGLSASKYVKRRWVITNNGVTGFTSYSPTFTFVAGDVQGNADPTKFIVSKLDGTSWSSTTTGSRTATSTQATGLTSFSEFALGEAGDNSAPTLTAVGIASNNTNASRAKVGDVVTLSFTASEAVGTPTVSLATHSVTPVAGSDNSFTATYTLSSLDVEGAVAFSIDFTDAAGNAGTQVSATTNASSVVFDRTAPTVISIDRKVPLSALTKNTSVLYTIKFSEPVTGISADDFTVVLPASGLTASVSTVSASSGTTIDVTVSSINGNGVLGLNLNNSNTSITDVASNPISGGFTGETYIIDQAMPTLTSVSIASDNVNTTYAKVGDKIIVTFASSETINVPTVTIAGQAASVTNVIGNQWKGEFTMTSSQTDGIVDFSVSFSDLADNAGIPATVTTNASSVIFDRTVPIINCPQSGTVSKQLDSYVITYTVQGAEFDADASDANLDSKIYVLSGATSGTGTALTNVTLNFGLTTITWKSKDRAGNESTCYFKVNVVQRATTLIIKQPTPIVSGQYSDQITLQAELKDADGNKLNGLPVVFKVGAVTLTAVNTNTNGLATTTYILDQNPNASITDNIVASFSGNSTYINSTDTDPFDIVKEDATITYSGMQFASTGSASSSVATVQLQAIVKDITATNVSADANEGNISNAKVTFIIRDFVTNNVLATIPNVSVVASADIKIGTATSQYTFNIGNDIGHIYTIESQIGGYYQGQSDYDNIDVAKPSQDFITGGGNVITDPNKVSGTYKPNDNSKINFGFNVKWNKSLTNPQGNMNLIFRKGAITYQVKATAIGSLSVDASSPCSQKATFSSKAVLNNATTGISITGNLALTVIMIDNVSGKDQIRITLMNGNTPYLVTDITDNVLTTLAGGSLSVQKSGVACTYSPSARINTATNSQAVDVTATAASTDLTLKASPNPTTSYFTLTVVSDKPNEAMTLRVLDLSGKAMEIHKNLVSGQTLQIGHQYRPGMYFAELWQGNRKRLVRLMKLPD